jgi:hypothetical protein
MLIRNGRIKTFKKGKAMRHKWGGEEILKEGEPVTGDHRNTCLNCGCIKTRKSEDGMHETQYRVGGEISRLAPLCDGISNVIAGQKI